MEEQGRHVDRREPGQDQTDPDELRCPAARDQRHACPGRREMRQPDSYLKRSTRMAVAAGLLLVVAGGAFAADSSAAAAAASSASPASAPGSEIAPAERLLFMETHLKGVQPQTELDYAVDRSGPPAKEKDTVRVLVTSPGNVNNDASVTDHGGKVDLPGGLPCNPVILYFLERDIAE